jgi:uncharacterized protein (TIGR03083 family)
MVAHWRTSKVSCRYAAASIVVVVRVPEGPLRWHGKGDTMDDSGTWKLIHARRATMADTLASLTPAQWAGPSLCRGWTVRDAAGHVLAGAEQTPTHFMKGMITTGFRFNALMDREARRNGAIPPTELVERLRATTTTTNHPPGPAMVVLGEIVVHGEDIRRPLGLPDDDSGPEAVIACLQMYSKGGFPVGGKQRVAGLRLVATDADWSHGAGPEVSGPGSSLLLAITGRAAGMDDLAGDGLGTLAARMPL